MDRDNNAYFSVSHHFKCYLKAWPQQQELPSEEQLKQMQSMPMNLISETKTQEARCLLQLRNLGDEGQAIIEFLKLQSRKVDLVLHHVMEQEQQDNNCYLGIKFGGSGVIIESEQPLEMDQCFKTSLYIRDQLVAIMAMAMVTDCHQKPDSPLFIVELSFCVILDADIEQLVKASLGVQQKQLRLRQQNRQSS